MKSDPFRNEPTLEFRRAAVRSAATEQLAALRARLPVELPANVATGPRLRSMNPANPAETVAVTRGANVDDARDAVGRAADAFPAWSARPADERAAILRRAAALLRQRRLQIAALAVLEAGKPWPEADGDVCEAIDFLEYYAIGVQELGHGRELVQLPGERNTLRYFARGVCAVIAPWNFPTAIPCGMVAAAIGTGNTVVFKPAEQTPACGSAVVEALHDAGVPSAALQLLCGGDEPAKALVADPRVHGIAFTGSCAAGLSIIRAAADSAGGQTHIKRVIAEMGGKNCIIVDADADLDDAVPAIMKSAFGFAGQKCSAASRVLVHKAVADELNTRLAGAVAALRVGPAEDFKSDLATVIDAEAADRISRYVRQAGCAPAGVAELPASPPADATYVAPMLFVDVAEDSPLITDEIFGPVLCSNRVDDVEAALAVVESGRFGLTGGLFSRSPATIEAVSARGIVGNLYINREITGAMVGRQPFGGGRLSGTGPKAGGPDYLLQFIEARSISENTVRHGLVV